MWIAAAMAMAVVTLGPTTQNKKKRTKLMTLQEIKDAVAALVDQAFAAGQAAVGGGGITQEQLDAAVAAAVAQVVAVKDAEKVVAVDEAKALVKQTAVAKIEAFKTQGDTAEAALIAELLAL